MGIEVFKKHLREKRAVRLSMGANGDLNKTALMATIVQKLHASALNIVYDKKAYEIARKNTKLPIFISSNHPYALLEAIKWGVDGIEIGKYELLRKKRKMYTPEELYCIILETITLAHDYDIFTSVCIPKEYKTEEKISLIKKLELLGIDLICIESVHNQSFNQLTDAINNSTMYFSMLIEDEEQAKEAYSLGAAGIDIEYITRKYTSPANIAASIMSIINSTSHKNSINKEIPRTKHEIFSY